MEIIYLCVLFSALLCGTPSEGQTSDGSLVAIINSGGLQGNIEFFPESTGKGVTIRILLRGNSQNEVYKWKIHEFPTIPSSADYCSEKIVGRSVHDFTSAHGYLSSGQDAMVTSTVKLDGINSIVGRTLVLKGTERGQLSCATIHPTSRIKTYKTIFYTPVGGDVYVRQTNFGTYLFSDLYYVNGTRKTTTHRWELVKTSVTESLQESHRHENSKCSDLQASPFLSPFLKGSEYISVGHSPGLAIGRTFHQLGDVSSLETIPGTIYLLIYSASEPRQVIACGRLLPMFAKQATAKFISSVSGEVSFKQESPYDPTLVSMDLEDLRQQAYSYGIDEFPIIYRGKKTPDCPNIAKVMYNPLKVQPEYIPNPGSGSMDQYAVGDLSGKYGSLQNRKKHFFQIYDPQLTLHGAHSIVGRAFVIYFPDGKPLACANVELASETITAFSTFVHPVQGQIIFRQAKDNPSSDTSVYIELSHSSSDIQAITYNHGWHIAESAVESDPSYSNSECNSAGSIYDPYFIDSSGSYACLCSPNHPLRCELGDLSSKLGYLDIPVYRYHGNESTLARHFFTTTNIPLSGPTSVIGKSSVIEQSDFVDDALTCANIYEYFSKRALKK